MPRRAGLYSNVEGRGVHAPRAGQAMKLLFVHQILIGAAIALAGIFGVRSIVRFAREGASTDLILAVVSIAIAIGLSFYLRKVRARLQAGEESVSLP